MADTVVTARIDGVPHRVLRTEFVDELEQANSVTLGHPRDPQRVRRSRRCRACSWRGMLREGRAMKSEGNLKWTQVRPGREHADVAAGRARRRPARRGRTLQWSGGRCHRRPAERGGTDRPHHERGGTDLESTWESCREQDAGPRRRELVHDRRGRARAARCARRASRVRTTGPPRRGRSAAIRARPAKPASRSSCRAPGSCGRGRRTTTHRPSRTWRPTRSCRTRCARSSSGAEQMVVLGQLATGADPVRSRGRHGNGARTRPALRRRRARVRRVAVGTTSEFGSGSKP